MSKHFHTYLLQYIEGIPLRVDEGKKTDSINMDLKWFIIWHSFISLVIELFYTHFDLNMTFSTLKRFLYGIIYNENINNNFFQKNLMLAFDN